MHLPCTGMRGKRLVNLIGGLCIQTIEANVFVDRLTPRSGSRIKMTTWHKRDWEQYYEMARRPWRRHRPPRPVYPTGTNRVLPAQGFSLSELDDAGVDLELPHIIKIKIDAGRIGAYGPNVTVLRDFIRSSRQPL